MFSQTLCKASLSIAIASATCQVLANGLAINEQSISGMGTGFAGRSSSAQDASTVFGNPAGMSRLERAEITAGIAAVRPKTKIKASATNPTLGSNKGDIAPNAAVPFGYYVRPLNEEWHFGIGVYVPFGVISDYESTYQGRDHGLYSKVQVITVQPTLSYKINDRVSIGFGPTINRIDGKLTSKPLAAAGAGAKVSIKGDDIGYGYNIGVLADLTDRLTWGMTYHSKVDYTLEGHTSFSGFSSAPIPGGALLDGKYKAKLDFTSPESVDTSVTYKANDTWTLYGGASWTRWSQLKDIEAINKGVNPLLGGQFDSVQEDLNWKDTWAYALGVAYRLNPEWVLRGGFSLDESPTTNTHRNVRIPVSNRKILSLGAGWDIDKDWTLDVAYSYLRESRGQVHQVAATGAPYDATYKNSAHGAGLQLTHRF